MQRFQLVCTALMAPLVVLATPLAPLPLVDGAWAAPAVPVPAVASHPAGAPAGPVVQGPVVQGAGVQGAASWPDGLSGSVLVATVAALEGDDRVAASAFRQAYGLDPAPPVLLRQAFLYSALAGDDAAVGLAARLSGQTMAELVMGNDAVMAGRWPEARAHYDRAPQDAMLAAIRPLMDAWTLLGAGQPDRALSVLEPLTGDRVLGRYYAVHAALIADIAGRHDQADRYYRVALAASSGQDLFSTWALGHWLIGQGHRDQATRLLDDLIAQGPGLSLARGGILAAMDRRPVVSPRQGIAQAYEFLSALIAEEAARVPDPSGRLAHDTGVRDVRMLLLRFALALDPGFGQARLLLSALQYDGGQAAAARDTIVAAAANDPLATVSQVQLARLDAATGRADEASRILTDLARAQPAQPQIWQTLGDLQSDHQDWAGAVSSFSRAIAATGQLSGDDWLLLFGRAVAYDRLARWPLAQADLQRALTLAPNEAMLLNYLGYSWVERDRNLPQAEALLRHAAAVQPDDAAIRDSLGWALVRQGRVAEGLGILERAAEQTPEDPAVNYHLGMAYWKVGRAQEAVNQWHVAQALPPDDPSDTQKISAALAEAARSGHEGAPLEGPPSSQKKD
jgi:Flp pilus assembly protein TadD